MKAWTFWVGVLSLMFSPIGGHGQSLSVAVAITEETGGLFESRMRSALRGLGDVEIAAGSTNPDFRLSGVVLCRPDQDNCRTATNYAVSLRLTRPLSAADLALGLYSADSTLVGASSWLPLEATAVALNTFEHAISSWAATWGRQVYQRAIDEFVAEIDMRCFERHRRRAHALSRLSDEDVEGWQAIMVELNQGDFWDC